MLFVGDNTSTNPKYVGNYIVVTGYNVSFIGDNANVLAIQKTYVRRI